MEEELSTTTDVTAFVHSWHERICPAIAKCRLGLSPCFWSCRPGKEMARNDADSFTDEDCLVLKRLFTYCSENKLNYGFALSQAYASFACGGVISVYMGTDKASEPVGFHVGNNFWCAELPYLRQLLRAGKISDIVFKIVEEGSVKREISVTRDVVDLPLWRRDWHPQDGAETKASFVWDDTDWESWRKVPPRPFLRYHRLLHYVLLWKRKSSSCK